MRVFNEFLVCCSLVYGVLRPLRANLRDSVSLTGNLDTSRTYSTSSLFSGVPWAMKPLPLVRIPVTPRSHVIYFVSALYNASVGYSGALSDFRRVTFGSPL